MRKEWPLSPNVELKAHFIAKGHDLCDEDEIATGSFVIADNEDMPSVAAFDFIEKHAVFRRHLCGEQEQVRKKVCR